MDEVDIENADDLNELEARLYAQIHHEPSGASEFSAYKEASPVRQVTATSVINYKSIDRTRGRYWNEKANFHTAIPKPKSDSTHLGQLEKEKQRSLTTGGAINEYPVETVDKTFQPPVKNLSNFRVNPFASGNGSKTKGSSTQLASKNVAAEKAKRIEPKVTNKGPFARQQNKLANALKYDGKKQKAKAAKANMKKNKALGTIELLSESETDDIIEVSVPSPKIVTIDTSSDEDNIQGTKEIESFLKPDAIVKENTSRCTSPCSVISDDFIGQNDRSRLREENSRADDEDLLRLQDDVDSLMEAPEKSTDIAPDSFATPTRGGSTKISTDYRVTQNAFRALDVYESESDIQESVYLKGSKNAKPSVVVNLEYESSSDDVQEVDITQKTKRLTKRRASSANKESETYIDTTDSEREYESGLNKIGEGVHPTSIPHIAYGEAVEKMVTEEEMLNQAVANSDNEFIATLNTLAQGTPSSVAAVVQNDSDEEEETITARSIAESVLKKNRPVETTTPTIGATEHDETANDAIPHDSLSELNEIFKNIDDMDKTIPDIEDSDDSDQSVQLIAPLPVSNKDRSALHKWKHQKEYGDPVYNIVYNEDSKMVSGGIGWNEEMRKFYNDSWHGERFTVKSVRAEMKTTKTLWKIYTDDRFPKYRKHSHQKCMNCCEFGHIRAKCPRPKKPPVCYMCGERGHLEPRCPNTICLRCGNKTRMFTKSCNSCNYQNRLICPICKVRGHSLNLCPDKWRRYHSTTKPNQYPNDSVEYKGLKLCCICGHRGHLPEHCRNAVNFSEYPMFVSEIRSHQKSYDDISIRTIRSGIGYNLMYEPDENISFELAENKTRQQYYGRFLLSVGMGYLLTRKRKVEENVESEPIVKQIKTTELKEYVVNPFAKKALEKTPQKPKARQSDNDVPIEINEEPITKESHSKEKASTSESISIDADEPSTSKGVTHIYDEVRESLNLCNKQSTGTAFKAPNATSPSILSEKTQEVMDLVDSGSNYSFSEHFEPTKKQQSNPNGAREMDPMPDFIPIDDDEDMDNDEPYELGNAGISTKFVSIETDEEEENRNVLSDLPCEAKIYLTHFHSKFLLSPEGNKFLIHNSKLYDIKARLELSSVGHILIIYGLRPNQDKFHIELLHKFRELSEKNNRNQLEKSQKIPKKTDILIRFLRENLNQLLSNLGNPNDLLKRLNYQEKQHTKVGWKTAEKTRRLLNMILIGQVGLRNGSKLLDNLLSHMRYLLDDCKDEVISNKMRDEIESNWRLIFSSYRHEKYTELVEDYNNLKIKNRFQNINIDPRLLGKKPLGTSLTVRQEKMDKLVNTLDITAGPEKISTPVKLVENPLSLRTPIKPPKTPVSEKKRLKNVPFSLPSVSQKSPLVPQKSPSVPQKSPNNQKQLAKVSQKTTDSPGSSSSKIKAVNAEWEVKCVNLLSEIDQKSKQKSGSPIRDNKAASMFWSREALKYVDECMELGRSNAGFLEKLSRVQIKSQKGLLSYNDYRAIIKIHNAIKSKQ